MDTINYDALNNILNKQIFYYRGTDNVVREAKILGFTLHPELETRPEIGSVEVLANVAGLGQITLWSDTYSIPYLFVTPECLATGDGQVNIAYYFQQPIKEIFGQVVLSPGLGWFGSSVISYRFTDGQLDKFFVFIESLSVYYDEPCTFTVRECYPLPSGYWKYGEETITYYFSEISQFVADYLKSKEEVVEDFRKNQVVKFTDTDKVTMERDALNKYEKNVVNFLKSTALLGYETSVVLKMYKTPDTRKNGGCSVSIIENF